MKRLLFSKSLAVAFIIASGLFSTGLLADTYVATLSGVECEGCKKTIAKSLGKLPGVQTIRIAKLGEEKHEMTVTTDGSASITQEQATEAIKHAEHYKIQTWAKSSKVPSTSPEKVEETPESWLTASGWDKIVGTWQEEDGPTISFTWKFPGKVLESFVKWGESEKYSVLWKHPESGEISILSLDNKGGQSKGTCVFETGKAVFKVGYVASNGRTGEKVTEYTFDGENLVFRINDGEPRKMVRQ